MRRYVLTLQCDDRPGIVRSLADGIFEAKGNILESSQFSDTATGRFFMRTNFESPEDNVKDVRATIAELVAPFDPSLMLRSEGRRRRTMIMVSRLDHCLIDLLYRWEIGELPIDIEVVVSNHDDCRPIAERHGVPFEHVAVTPATKSAAEARMLELMDEHAVDFVVLARYMQILSNEVCARLPGRVINIHHSFLPGFKGAKPYQQAFDRGVKLIGATAHYVTADLDEGPIIEQDVVRVTHADDPGALAAVGRDVERVVLARAVRLHAEDRVLVSGARTVVFT